MFMENNLDIIAHAYNGIKHDNSVPDGKITEAKLSNEVKTKLNNAIPKTDIVDNLADTSSDKPISARAVNEDVINYIDGSISDTLAYIDQQDASEHAGRVAGDNLLNARIDALNPEDFLSYGVRWEANASNPDCERIGNMQMHKTLPIQSAFKGCIAQGGKVQYYLNANNWGYKEDGVTESVLNGADGTVRVDTGHTFYGKTGVQQENGKTYYWVRLSLTKIDDTWTEIPRMLIDAYRSTILNDHTSAPGYLNTLPNNSAISVVNDASYCRGGNNRTAYDEYLSTDKYKTDLGKPRTNMSRANMRIYANNAGTELICYEWYKWIMFWCPIIEYATFNLQKTFNATLTTEGYHQGGLDAGVTNWTSDAWDTYNGYCPLTPCGEANSLGNNTGVVSFTANGITSKIARYRGFENVFGDIWTNLDGVLITGTSVYTTTDKIKFNDSSTADYKLTGTQYNANGYTKEWYSDGNKVEFIPASVGGGTTTYKCDYFYQNAASASLHTLLVGGDARHGASAGVGCFASLRGVADAHANIGLRCLNKYEE